MNTRSTIDRLDLRRKIKAFQRPGRWKSIWQLTNSLIPYGILWYLAYLVLGFSFWITLPIVVLMAGFLVRIFIIFHDCGHGSFFRSRKANEFWGVLTGILTFTPFHQWRASHARHHGTSGNLDKRGEGDVWMMTLREYIEAPRRERIKYRLYRNPLIMFLLGPLFITLISNRMTRPEDRRKERVSVYVTNIAVALISALLISLLGWKVFVLIQLPALFLAHVAGVWLFYVQHQFEGVYWERNDNWDFVTAALKGGSFYRLPGILKWFSGSIGYHHVHHLDARIPNYNLDRCHKCILPLQEAKTIGLFSSFKSLRYRLWDEDSNRLVGFREIRKRRSVSQTQTS